MRIFMGIAVGPTGVTGATSWNAGGGEVDAHVFVLVLVVVVQDVVDTLAWLSGIGGGGSKG